MHTQTESPLVQAKIQHLQEVLAQEIMDIDAQRETFVQRYPTYTKTSRLDDLRQTEYNRLDDLGQVYLDYTGGGLYARSQLQKHIEILLSGVYGNPHSSNPTSMAMTELDEQARQYVLEYFHADPNEYVVIFTPNASGALRLVGEAYPFDKNGRYLLTYDNHNSVNGIREFARKQGAKITYTPVAVPDLLLDANQLEKNLALANPDGNNLFAFPAQSNFSGVQHPLEWIAKAQAQGWDVLLDAAAFVPTNCLDLAQYKPDFMCISFYKMFGYPTGIGALIAKRDSLKKLQRPWFAGGTIRLASVQTDVHSLVDGAAGFEDGTIDYLNLPAVEIGLRHLTKIGVECVHERVRCLTGYLIDELQALHHDNGHPLVRIYGTTNLDQRGGTLAINFFDPMDTIFDLMLVESLANSVKISLRTGVFCNPGAGELALQIGQEEIVSCGRGESNDTLDAAIQAFGIHEDVGAVRVSVGLATNFEDVYRFLQFARTFLNTPS